MDSVGTRDTPSPGDKTPISTFLSRAGLGGGTRSAVLQRVFDLGDWGREASRPQNNVRLRTLVLIRWLAVVGQTAAVLIVAFVLGFDMPLGPCFAVISTSVVFNLLLQIRNPFSERVSMAQATTHSAFDLVQLAALLYWTGGVQNPFTLLLLAPITIAATVLNLRATVFLGGLGFLLITFLLYVRQPLPWYPGETLIFNPIYLHGLWVSLGLGILFSSAYAWRVSVEADRMRTALSATQQVLSREQRLAALGSLAAAAAHELGTPLATIAITAKELSRDLTPDSPMYEDVELLRDQAYRCREILSRLSQEPGENDLVMRRMELGVLLGEVAAPHRDFGVDVEVVLCPPRMGPERTDAIDTEDPEPHVLRRPEILYGLGNIVENAVDFGRERVEITAWWNPRDIWVQITDDGPGFAAEILDRLGEPYVTSRRPPAETERPGSGGTDGAGSRGLPDEGQHGMGLGFFIAKTLLERTGATVRVANRAATPSSKGALAKSEGRRDDEGTRAGHHRPVHGAIVTVRWPRDAVESP
ncbi:MAG: ActS/PrrB/RegB family redox-sensitive histidine kinase [Alphaproteobacteria bacterium]